MSTLAAVLVRQHALPLEAIEQAMLRQSLFGGDLATNLLELESIEEPVLLECTAAALEVPALAPGRIDVDPNLTLVCHGERPLEHPFLPIADIGDCVLVAIATPLPAGLLTQLQNQLGKPISLRAALEVRLRQALATALGQALDERLEKLLTRIDNDAKPEQASRTIETALPKRSFPAGKISLLPTKRDAKAQGPARRLGPFTAAMAEIELAAAHTPGSIIGIWLDFTAQYFEYTAIFAVQGDIAAGKAARGKGTTAEAFSRIGVPLDLPGALQRARSAGTWQLGPLEPRGLDRTLARDLGRPIGASVLLLPICVKQRVVLLSYGDHGHEDVSLDQVGDVLALKPLVERHLERLLVERKRASRTIPPGHAKAEQQAHPSVPPQAEPRGASHGPSHPQERELPDAGLPHDAHSAAGPAASNVDTGTIDDSWDLIQPVLTLGNRDDSPSVRAATNNPAARLRDSIPPDSGWANPPTRLGPAPKLELLPDTDLVSSTERSEVPNSLVAQAKADETQTTTKVPVEAVVHSSLDATEERACLDLLERFKQGDTSALAQLVALGETAALSLARALPGPIVTPSRAPRLDANVKASDAGPVLKVLAALGSVAVPHVIARTADTDPKVRVWAIRLLGELLGRASALAVAERIVLDRDAEVRRASYLASQQLLRDPTSAEALRQALLGVAADGRAMITQRLAAIDAIADLRDPPSIPKLIELLSDPNPGTAAAAQQALTVLARQDFGYDAKTWTTWWNNNVTRDRIEWVIDALDHRSPTIRQAASEELRLVSRLYVGNFDDDSYEARAKIQKKYRDWWAAGGRSPSTPAKL